MATKEGRNVKFFWASAGIWVLCGVVIGLFAVETYHLAGASMFCGACHSMKHVTDRWSMSRHKQFACVECHMPTGSIFTKLAYKAARGTEDLVDEALRDYPATLAISGKGKEIVNGNCLRCHYSTVENIPLARGGGNCVKCHHYLVHGKGPDKGGIPYVEKK